MTRRSEKRGGKPRDPAIRALMESEGISRQAAWYRLRRATGRPAGRPRKKATSAAKGMRSVALKRETPDLVSRGIPFVVPDWIILKSEEEKSS